MGSLLTLLSSTGLTSSLLSMAVSTGAGVIYPRVVDAIQQGGTMLATWEHDSPLVQEGVNAIKSLLPGITNLSVPDQATVSTTLGTLLQGAVGALTASDLTVTGTKPTTALSKAPSPAPDGVEASPAPPPEPSSSSVGSDIAGPPLAATPNAGQSATTQGPGATTGAAEGTASDLSNPG